MPENKEKIEKEVMEELEKKGVKANKEVIQGLSDLAMEGISSGMSRTAAVTLSVGGAAAMALLSGGAAWFATKKVKDKEIAKAQEEARTVRGLLETSVTPSKGLALYKADGTAAANVDEAVLVGNKGETDVNKMTKLASIGIIFGKS